LTEGQDRAAQARLEEAIRRQGRAVPPRAAQVRRAWPTAALPAERSGLLSRALELLSGWWSDLRDLNREWTACRRGERA
jgi:hypothetical protein